MKASPQQAGRGPNGRFAKGNTAAKGNPYARKAAAFRRALYDSVNADDISAIVETLKREAVAGDLKAINILLDRLLGPATIGLDLLERMERLEAFLGPQEPKAGGEDAEL